MRVKSEKIAEICTFFFETRQKWQPYIANQSISHKKCPEQEDSLSRTRMRTPSNSDVVFLLSQVSHLGGRYEGK